MLSNVSTIAPAGGPAVENIIASPVEEDKKEIDDKPEVEEVDFSGLFPDEEEDY